MKKALLFISAALLAACANNNGNADNDNTATPQTEAIEKTHEVDWEKPQYSLDDHGDTISRWIYDERGRLSQILTDYDDKGVPRCVTQYTYTGNNKAHVVCSCQLGYTEDITYTDESCTKIHENNGQIYEYDEEGRISKIIIGNNEITYDYSITKDGYIHADIIGNLFQQMEERDGMGRLISESYVDGMDIHSTTYTYEGNVCHVRVENTIYEKDGDGDIPDLDKSNVNEYEYDIYY